MDKDLLLDFGISILVTTLKSLKGPEKRKQFKAAFSKVNKLIAGVYGEDEDFRAVWQD